MFDHNDTHTTFVERRENGQDLVDLGTGEPSHRFIRNQQPRPGRHGPGQFELAQLDQGKVGRAHVGLGLKANELEDRHSLGSHVSAAVLHRRSVGQGDT